MGIGHSANRSIIMLEKASELRVNKSSVANLLQFILTGCGKLVFKGFHLNNADNGNNVDDVDDDDVDDDDDDDGD